MSGKYLTKEEAKELMIGEVGEIDGVKVRCVEDVDGIGCPVCRAVVVVGYTPSCTYDGPCDCLSRDDGKNVHFEAVTE